MTDNVRQFRGKEYDAKPFTANAGTVPVVVSGTLCGNIDLAFVGHLTFCLTPDEAQGLIIALTNSRADVLANSRPFSDRRIVERDHADR